MTFKLKLNLRIKNKYTGEILPKYEMEEKLRKYRRTYYVYVLCDENHYPFYVGKGTLKRSYKTTHRLFVHEKQALYGKIGPMYDYIRKLHEKGSCVYYATLGTANSEYLIEAMEAADIKSFGRQIEGGSLFNKTIGFQGCSGFTLSKETKQKLRKANLGKIPSIETREKLRKAMIGRIMTPTHLINLKNAWVLSDKRKNFYNKIRKPCKIFGIVYACKAEASKALSINQENIRYRIKAGWDGYEELSKAEYEVSCKKAA